MKLCMDDVGILRLNLVCFFVKYVIVLMFEIWDVIIDMWIWKDD